MKTNLLIPPNPCPYDVITGIEPATNHQDDNYFYQQSIVFIIVFMCFYKYSIFLDYIVLN